MAPFSKLTSRKKVTNTILETDVESATKSNKTSNGNNKRKDDNFDKCIRILAISLTILTLLIVLSPAEQKAQRYELMSQHFKQVMHLLIPNKQHDTSTTKIKDEEIEKQKQEIEELKIKVKKKENSISRLEKDVAGHKKELAEIKALMTEMKFDTSSFKFCDDCPLTLDERKGWKQDTTCGKRLEYIVRVYGDKEDDVKADLIKKHLSCRQK